MRTCYYCGERVDPDAHNVWQATSTWSLSGRIRSGGSRGGTDRVEFRRWDYFACDDCVTRLKAGTLHQEALL